MRRKPLWITGIGLVSLIALVAVGFFLVRVPQAAHAESDGVTVTARTIPGVFDGQFTNANAINNLGHVVGSANTETGAQYAFIWDSNTPDTPPQPLMGLSSDSTYSVANDINNYDVIVGYSDGQLVEWITPTSEPTPLPLPDTTSGAFMGAINDNGDIVGTVTNADGVQVPIAWVDGVPIPLQIPDGSTGCQAADINAQQEIVGGCGFSSAPYSEGFYWASPDADVSPVLLNPLVPNLSGGVSAINNLGHAVGISAISATQGRATMWLTPNVPASLPVDLGPDLPPEQSCSDCGIANAVNNLDQAVGLAATVGPALFESGAVIGLTMPDDCPGGGWAFGINDVGQAIGGYTSCGRAVLWTIIGSLPTPTPTFIPPTPTPIPTQLTALAPANVWVGLKNSDDVGLRLDLRAEVYANGSLVTSGELQNFAAGSSKFNNARLNSIPFDAFAPVSFPPGSTLSLKLYERNTCTGPTHHAGTARFWYNDSAANSNVGATIGGASSSYYLVDGSQLSTTVGAGPKKTIDVAAGAPCSAYKLIGTWAITP